MARHSFGSGWPFRLGLFPNFSNLSFGRWVLLIQLLATLPVLGLAVWVTYELVQERESQQKQALQRRTEVTALTLSRELDGARVALRGLLLTEAALRGDMPAVQGLAARAVAADSDLLAISAWRPAGHRLFSVPEGPAPIKVAGHATDEAIEAAFDAAGETLLPLETTAADHVCLAAPWPLAGQKALLRVSFRRQTLATVLNEQRWPPTWIVSLVDSRFQVAVRSRGEEEFLGREVAPPLRRHLETGGRGLLEAPTLDGTPSLAAAAAVPGTGWWVVVAVPVAELSELAQRSLRKILAGGLLLVLLGSAAAWAMSRSLVRQVSLAAGPEVDYAAAPEKALRVRELLHIHRRHHRTSEALHQAQHDTLTGLPARALFMEQLAAQMAALPAPAEAPRAAPTAAASAPAPAYHPAACAPANPAEAVASAPKLALLYLDLDGFKATNDRLGHAAGDRLLVDFGRLLRRCLAEADLQSGEMLGAFQENGAPPPVFLTPSAGLATTVQQVWGHFRESDRVRGADAAVPRHCGGRVGGDEFAVSVLGEDAEATARQLASRLLAEVPRLGAGMGCSLGLALAQPGETLEALMGRADMAMLSAKRAGKQQLVVAG